MNNQQAMIETFEARAKRREERREFFRASGGAAVALAGASLLSACGGGDDTGAIPQPTPTPGGTPPPTPTPTPSEQQDLAVLSFALNLEYLEANFYSYAATGNQIPVELTGGAGVKGQALGGRQVNFTDPVVAAYAREIAADELAHVRFLRQALGSAVVGQPPMDLGTEPDDAFSNAARAAGLIGAGQSFDPYASDENFLLGAFIFEDVGVTAYKGASPLITNKTFLEAAAGILAAEAYHAGLIRTVLYRKGVQTPALRDATEAISDARDSLDGAGDVDQGIQRVGAASNIVPADSNGIAFSRSVGQVLNIAYLTEMAATRGGFFPLGVNGTFKTSAANG